MRRLLAFFGLLVTIFIWLSALLIAYVDVVSFRKCDPDFVDGLNFCRNQPGIQLSDAVVMVIFLAVTAAEVVIIKKFIKASKTGKV
jgi:hypothetical protein